MEAHKVSECCAKPTTRVICNRLPQLARDRPPRQLRTKGNTEKSCGSPSASFGGSERLVNLYGERSRYYNEFVPFFNWSETRWAVSMGQPTEFAKEVVRRKKRLSPSREVLPCHSSNRFNRSLRICRFERKNRAEDRNSMGTMLFKWSFASESMSTSAAPDDGHATVGRCT
jgi:hypothetical protein